MSRVRRMSVCDTVSDVPSCCLRWPHNLHDLTFTHAEVPSDSVLALYLRQLLCLGSISFEQLTFLRVIQQHVSGHKLVLCNVHKQLVLDEKFEVVGFVTFERLLENLRRCPLDNKDGVKKLCAHRVSVVVLTPLVHELQQLL